MTKRVPTIAGGVQQVINNVMAYVGCCEAIMLRATRGPCIIEYINNYMLNEVNNPTGVRINVYECESAKENPNCATQNEDTSDIYIMGNVHKIDRPNAASGSEQAMVMTNTAGGFSGANLRAQFQSTTNNPVFPTIPTLMTAVEALDYVRANAGDAFPSEVRITFE